MKVLFLIRLKINLIILYNCITHLTTSVDEFPLIHFIFSYIIYYRSNEDTKCKEQVVLHTFSRSYIVKLLSHVTSHNWFYLFIFSKDCKYSNSSWKQFLITLQNGNEIIIRSFTFLLYILLQFLHWYLLRYNSLKQYILRFTQNVKCIDGRYTVCMHNK